MKHCWFLFSLVILVNAGCSTVPKQDTFAPRDKIKLFKKAMTELYENLEAEKMSDYFHPDFIMKADKNYSYKDEQEYLVDSQKTKRKYFCAYNDESAVESEDGIGIWLDCRTQMPGAEKKEASYMIIVKFREGKFYRWYEIAQKNSPENPPAN